MNKKINEELTKTEINKQIKVYMDSSEFKNKIEKIVKEKLKKETEYFGFNHAVNL